MHFINFGNDSKLQSRKIVTENCWKSNRSKYFHINHFNKISSWKWNRLISLQFSTYMGCGLLNRRFHIFLSEDETYKWTTSQKELQRILHFQMIFADTFFWSCSLFVFTISNPSHRLTKRFSQDFWPRIGEMNRIFLNFFSCYSLVPVNVPPFLMRLLYSSNFLYTCDVY